MARRKLGIFFNMIAPYRIPWINLFADNPEFQTSAYSFVSRGGDRDWVIDYEDLKVPHVLLKGVTLLGKYMNPGIPLLMLRERFHTVVIGGYTDISSWLVFFFAKAFGARVVLISATTKHTAGGTLNNPIKNMMKRVFIGGADAVIVNGKDAMEYAALFTNDTKKLFIEYTTVDVERFTALAEALREEGGKDKAEDGAVSLLYVGRVVRAKGIFELIEAACKLNKKGYSITVDVLGSGPDEPSARKTAYDLGIADKVVFHGYVQQDAIHKYFGAADVFVFLTHKDTWGLVVNEAMCFSLPVLVSKYAGCARELVDVGKNGFVVDPFDQEEVVRALEAILGDEARRREMGQTSLVMIKGMDMQNAYRQSLKAICYDCALDGFSEGGSA